MKIPDIYSNFVYTLLEKTERGNLMWINNDSYMTETFTTHIDDSNSVNIWAGYADSGERFISFALIDRYGEVSDSWYVDRYDEDFTLMQELYNAARRSANGINETIQNLQAILDKKQ